MTLNNGAATWLGQSLRHHVRRSRCDALPDVSVKGDVGFAAHEPTSVYLARPPLQTLRAGTNSSQAEHQLRVTAEKMKAKSFLKAHSLMASTSTVPHLFLRDVGPVKALALAITRPSRSGPHYERLGLLGKSAFTMNIKRNAPGLSPYASVEPRTVLTRIADR